MKETKRFHKAMYCFQCIQFLAKKQVLSIVVWGRMCYTKKNYTGGVYESTQ